MTDNKKVRRYKTHKSFFFKWNLTSCGGTAENQHCVHLILLEKGSIPMLLFIELTFFQLHCPSKKKVALWHFVGLPLALSMARICCGIVLISFCNVITFISIHSCINFLPRSYINDGRVAPLSIVFSITSQRFLSWGLRSGLDSVVANPYVKRVSHIPWTTHLQCEPDECWHCHLGICPCHQWINTWSFTIFR